MLEQVRPWALSRFNVSLPTNKTVICGFSAGGEASLAVGFRHPDIFGAVFSCSPGTGYRPPQALPDLRPAVYLVAGNREPFFMANTQRWADALCGANGDCVIVDGRGPHGDAFWTQEIPVMLAWALKDE